MSNKQEEKTWDEYNKFYSYLDKNSELKEAFESGIKYQMDIMVRQSRQSGVARATCPD